MDRFLATLRKRLPVALPQATCTFWPGVLITSRNPSDMEMQPSLNAVMLAWRGQSLRAAQHPVTREEHALVSLRLHAHSRVQAKTDLAYFPKDPKPRQLELTSKERL